MKQSYRKILYAVIGFCLLGSGCMKETAEPQGSALSFHPMEEMNAKLEDNSIEDWYSEVYEIFPYSFYDSDGDGIGDLNGITEKIPYIKELGFQNVWLTPIQQAVSYHKYDVTDYYAIDSEFGTMEDFEAMISALHANRMRYIMDLVLNHTSEEHPWFQQAVNYLKSTNTYDSAQCPYLEYYHFSKVFQSGYTQITGTDWYYESQFTDTMPDLNLDSESVRDEITKIVSFWIEKGVDGFRLDAVTSYGTGDPDYNIAVLQWLNGVIKSIQPDTYIIAEAWTTQQEYKQYYSSGIDSLFDFAYASNDGVIAQTVRGTYSGSDFVHALTREEERYHSFDANAINAPFYTNHDLARSAGYYTGDNALAQTKLALALNFLQTGNAFLYYGEEIGMKGSGKDENKRAMMQWGESQGMCTGPKNMDDFAMKYPDLSQQKTDPDSLYTYVRNILIIRRHFSSIARGETIQIDSGNDAVGMFTRTYNNETVLVCINSSSQEQRIAWDDAYTLKGMLLTSEDIITCQDGMMVLPAYAVGVFE